MIKCSCVDTHGRSINVIQDCVLPLLNLAWSVLPPLISPLKPIVMMVHLLMRVGLSSSKVVDLLNDVP